MRSSLIDLSNMPKQSCISVVDLNNKETSSILLQRMKCEEEKQNKRKIERLKSPLLRQNLNTSTPNSLSSLLSYSSCSSISPLSPPMSPTLSYSSTFDYSKNSSIESNASEIELNSSYPFYKRVYNATHPKLVSLKKNL